ncbi:MAG TPA: biotin-dependent carboxyltransferase family protein [Planococcus sp. (in: firmicutes)]|nr:biotin-dependent carboxyltransferase family protein [Planococcus sp. (in: firmicutes)]
MLKIIKSGMQTTVQDLGRYGFQKYGVIASGVMDPFAHRIANLLAGNEENAATLEITLVGPVIQFSEDTCIALCGGNLSPKINDQEVGMWRTIAVQKGDTLTFGSPRNGCRSYLAVSGGLAVPEVMSTRSTYLRAGIGGFQGRALKAGDEIGLNPFPVDRTAALIREMDWLVPPLHYSDSPVIRMMEGRQFHLFNEFSKQHIFTEPFSVSSHSDRMGYRLEGSPLLLEKSSEMISEAVAFGSIQVPSDGNPIVLLADRQTTGGYPKIGQIASVDLPLISQLKPGDQLSFRKISLEESQALYIGQEQQIQQIKAGIQLKREEWK